VDLTSTIAVEGPEKVQVSSCGCTPDIESVGCYMGAYLKLLHEYSSAQAATCYAKRRPWSYSFRKTRLTAQFAHQTTNKAGPMVGNGQSRMALRLAWTQDGNNLSDIYREQARTPLHRCRSQRWKTVCKPDRQSRTYRSNSKAENESHNPTAAVSALSLSTHFW
jgi:MoaA/NifB/PqqE/SkfB family radical SAM enzyme